MSDLHTANPIAFESSSSNSIRFNTLRLRSFAWLLFVYFFSSIAAAQVPGPEAVIPSSLKDWRAWVLSDLDYRGCPFLATQAPDTPDGFRCAWPGRLTLNAAADGASFSVRWRVEADRWIPLPGDAGHWPQQVTVNSKSQPVLERDGVPSVWLTRGSYEIQGRIPWRERPQSLRIPERVGLLALTVDGKSIAQVQRDNNEITLGRSAAAATPEADSLQLRVYRKLGDGVPATLTSQIQLVVSGQAREEVIGPVLPEGFIPTALVGGWPARLDDDGRIRVQVQPGTMTLTLEARTTSALANLTVHLPAAPWPKQEIWSYEADPRLRVTAARAATPVDPRQAEVPNEWSALPAFALGDGGTLEVEQRSRGAASDEGNRLTLNREAWLDFAGDGWLARDEIRGQMVQGWRLDVAAPFTLERADAANSRLRTSSAGEALLITQGAGPDVNGVEWRTPRVDLKAAVRIAPARAELAVAGWRQTFDRVDTTLHFPYGYKLIGAPGADSASGSWMSRWTLLDAFVCAIVALLAWRLLGLAVAAATVAYLLLGYQESGSPLWTLLVVLALALILRALPAGRLARVVGCLRLAALLFLVVTALPFLADQVRFALHPQLEDSAGFASHGLAEYAGGFRDNSIEPQSVAEAEAPVVMQAQPMSGKLASPSPAPPPAGAVAAKAMKSPSRAGGVNLNAPLDAIPVASSHIRRVDIVDHYGESTVVQTGAGEPSWNLGSSAQLSWTGPVLATQKVSLIIAPPWMVRALRVVLVALLAWLLWRLYRAGAMPRRIPGAALGAALILVAAFATSAPAQADEYPSEELLQQLRQRLTEPPKCAPQCASVAEAQVGANGDVITLALLAHVGELVALPLPRADNATLLKSIKVDGVAEEAVVRGADGMLWLELGRGVHRVELEYTALADKVALEFALKPAHVLLQAQGWQTDGLSDEHLLTETLSLVRARASNSGKPVAGVQQFPTYVSVQRHLMLGLDWSIDTQVQRISPKQGGFAVSAPLLAGEHVSTSGLKVADGKVTTALASGEEQTTWHSTLDKADSLTLTAPALGDRAEVWSVVVSPTWHVEFSGVPGVGAAVGEGPDDYRDFEFHPLPGEVLTLKITRPAAVQGAMRAIDAVDFVSEIGQHASTRTLGFSLRASQGGEHAITLPADAEVLSVTRDGRALNLRPQEGKLSLPVVPGNQRFEIRLRDAQEAAWFVRTPEVGLGLPAANIGLSLTLPQDRWLLGAFGPQVGPAVLYWGELVVMIAIAFVLAKTRRTRLGFFGWLLLGLGFSTFSWGALLIVVAWLFAFDWRARAQPSRSTLRFNLVQIGLVLLTVVALLCLMSAIPQGLLGQPDMHVAGYGSSDHSLQWFADRSVDTLPQVSAVSVPLWVYKVLMLAWAIWLANALIGWLRDGFAAWTKDDYWRRSPKVIAAAAAAPAGEVATSDPPTA